MGSVGGGGPVWYSCEVGKVCRHPSVLSIHSYMHCLFLEIDDVCL